MDGALLLEKAHQRVLHQISGLRYIYQTGIFLYVWAIRLAGRFNPKARLWSQGRKDLWQKLENLPAHTGKTVWVHCASLGEFEQGRPVMEALKRQHPQVRIVLTFFSPSGYEIRKNYAGADAVFYLPPDLPGAAARFYDAVKPDLGLIIKYEFWQGYLHEAHRRRLPLFLVSGIFRTDMPFFRAYGGYFRQGLKAFEHFFIQDENSRLLLQAIGFENATVCGDTRLDRVLEAVEKRTPLPIIEKFKGLDLLWVCGSTWPADDEMILHIIRHATKEVKLLLVPHDIHPEYINRLSARCVSVRFANYSDGLRPELPVSDVLILDTVGLLSSAYAYADMVYVGGGFGKAVHNTMEPAAYGVPVLFGPEHHKFREIAGLMEAGGGLCVHSQDELEKEILRLSHEAATRTSMGNAARHYVETHAGATPIILQALRTRLV